MNDVKITEHECEECHGEGAVVVEQHPDGTQDIEECDYCNGTGVWGDDE